MTGELFISVIVPVFNGERFLAEALDSVLAQTYGNWEIIIVDDGSTDATNDIVAKYRQTNPERIRSVCHPERSNCGLPASRNAGASAARGDYISFLDADDVWLPRKLEEQMRLFAQFPQAGMVCGSPLYWYSWNKDGSDQVSDYVRDLGLQRDKLYSPPELLRLIYPLGKAVAATPSDVCVRRDAFECVFDFHANMYEDTAFLVKLYRRQHVYISSQCWTWYRRHSGSISATVSKNRQQHRESRLYFARWLQKYLADLDDEGIQAVAARFHWETAHPRLAAVRRRLRRIALP